MRWIVLLIVLTGCEKLSIKFINKDGSSDNGVPFYIIAGQSNCGRSRTSQMSGGESALYSGVISNTKIFNPAPFYRGLVGSLNDITWDDLNVGTNTMLTNAINNDEFGCEASLMKNLQDHSSKARRVLKFGSGNTDLAVQWIPGGFLNTSFYQALDEAVEKAVSDGVTLDLKAFIWMQGENDATNATWAANYQTNLGTFFSDFATKWQTRCTNNGFAYDSGFRRVIGRITSATLDGSQVYLSTVRDAQTLFCTTDSNKAVLINTDSYTLFDGVHFNATSQITFGSEIFKVVKNL